MIDDIGARVRTLRKNKDITLTELAAQSGLSASFISNLERNLCSPTIENLQRICEALGIPLIRLLDSKGWQDPLIRADQRSVLYKEEGKIRYESIDFGESKLDDLIITLEPNCTFDKMWAHAYDEIGLVLEGELTIALEDKTYVLHEGDSFYVEAMSKHSFSNNSDVYCRSYWVKQAAEDHI